MPIAPLLSGWPIQTNGYDLIVRSLYDNQDSLVQVLLYTGCKAGGSCHDEGAHLQIRGGGLIRFCATRKKLWHCLAVAWYSPVSTSPIFKQAIAYGRYTELFGTAGWWRWREDEIHEPLPHANSQLQWRTLRCRKVLHRQPQCLAINSCCKPETPCNLILQLTRPPHHITTAIRQDLSSDLNLQVAGNSPHVRKDLHAASLVLPEPILSRIRSLRIRNKPPPSSPHAAKGRTSLRRIGPI
mmetsp:Transcript_24252/g.56323  ORF Transcript_24252/g.56323 Transcript_24252/m.56323 type:complete len:240 (-) Transcript_24252:47-766(-)